MKYGIPDSFVRDFSFSGRLQRMKARQIAIIVVSVLALTGLWLLLSAPAADTGEAEQLTIAEPPMRIISMAPSITETLFALGHGSKVIARTRYCAYPPEVLEIPGVGGYFDPNYELILSMDADLVILFPEHEEVRGRLRSFGIPFLTVRQQTLASIEESFVDIAIALGNEPAGRNLAREFREGLASAEAVSAPTRPKTLVVVGRSVAEDYVREVYVAGNDTFYGELVELAGGENCYQGQITYPALSAESIINLDPEVIIEIAVEIADNEKEGFRGQWRPLETVSAVAEGRVHILNQAYAAVPGPRLVQLARDFHAIIESARGHE